MVTSGVRAPTRVAISLYDVDLVRARMDLVDASALFDRPDDRRVAIVVPHYLRELSDMIVQDELPLHFLRARTRGLDFSAQYAFPPS